MCRPCDIVISVLQFVVISSCVSPNLSVKPNNVQQQPASDVCKAYRLRRIACDNTFEDCCVSWFGLGNKLRVSCQRNSILFPHATCWFLFWCVHASVVLPFVLFETVSKQPDKTKPWDTQLILCFVRIFPFKGREGGLVLIF